MLYYILLCLLTVHIKHSNYQTTTLLAYPPPLYTTTIDFEDQTRELNRMLEQELKLPVPSGNNHGHSFNGNNTSGGGNTSNVSGTGTNRNISSANNTNELDNNNTTSALDNHSFERIQNFEEAFNKIKAATGITDIEELVR